MLPGVVPRPSGPFYLPPLQSTSLVQNNENVDRCATLPYLHAFPIFALPLSCRILLEPLHFYPASHLQFICLGRRSGTI
jgi:hypothetical protein